MSNGNHEKTVQDQSKKTTAERSVRTSDDGGKRQASSKAASPTFRKSHSPRVRWNDGRLNTLEHI